MSSNSHTGKVKFFNETKGFGFIIPDSGGPDVFVHHTDIKTEGYRTLATDQKVTFEIEQAAKGQKAVNVI